MPDLAERLGIAFRDVRSMVRDRWIVGIALEGVTGYRVPSAFLEPGTNLVVDGLRGSIVQLTDLGMSDAEILEWMLSPHPELDGLTPAAALARGKKHAVRRAAVSA